MTEANTIWNYLIPGITFGLASAAQPGPLMLYLISRTLQTGWKRTVPAVFAPLISDGPIAAVCLLILGSLPAGFLHYVRIAGGIFILWLAFGAVKAWKIRKPGGQEVRESGGRAQTLFGATLVNFLNPGPYIGWSLVIGPMLLEGWRQTPVNGISLLSGFYLTMFFTSGLILFLVDKANERVPKLQRVLLGISALFLGLFGIYQIVTGVVNLTATGTQFIGYP